MSITIGHQAEWEPIFRGERADTNKLKRCESCGGVRMDLGGEHGAHYRDGVLVDCVGKPVKP